MGVRNLDTLRDNPSSGPYSPAKASFKPGLLGQSCGSCYRSASEGLALASPVPVPLFDGDEWAPGSPRQPQELSLYTSRCFRIVIKETTPRIF